MDAYLQKLDDVQLCGTKTVYWREFLKTLKTKSALAIIAEYEVLLDLDESGE